MPSLSEETYPRPVRLVEVAPGVKFLAVKPDRIPALAVCEAVPMQIKMTDGTTRTVYHFRERIHEAWLRVSEAERLPLGLSAESINKLIAAGMVEGGRGAPNAAMVNVISLLDHIETNREDPEWWDREDRRRRFKMGAKYEPLIKRRKR